MLLLVSLLWGLVSVVHCQTVPYVSFIGVNLLNHSYVIISDIGTAGDDTALLCHTNHPADIPGGTDGMHSGGNWFAPDQTEVSSGSSAVGFRRNRGSIYGSKTV